MEKPQHRLRNHLPIVPPPRPRRRLVRIRLFHTPRLHSHLQLPLNMPLGKLHVALTSKQPLLDVYALHLRVVRGGPDVHICPELEQVGCLRAGRVDDVVEVHLVQAYSGGCGFEEFLADGGEDERGVRELPLPVGLGLDRRAEGAAEDLVPEADACEADVGAVGPDVCGRLVIYYVLL